jgi:uncharacterized membrane protein
VFTILTSIQDYTVIKTLASPVRKQKTFLKTETEETKVIVPNDSSYGKSKRILIISGFILVLGSELRALTLARQVLYHLSHSASLHY